MLISTLTVRDLLPKIKLRCHDSCLFCFWKHLLCLLIFLKLFHASFVMAFLWATPPASCSPWSSEAEETSCENCFITNFGLVTCFCTYSAVFKHFSLVNTKQCINTAVRHTHVHNWMMKEVFPFLYTISSKIFLLIVVYFPILWTKALKLISHLINELQPSVG